jgi:hypothetical protein
VHLNIIHHRQNPLESTNILAALHTDSYQLRTEKQLIVSRTSSVEIYVYMYKVFSSLHEIDRSTEVSMRGIRRSQYCKAQYKGLVSKSL